MTSDPPSNTNALDADCDADDDEADLPPALAAGIVGLRRPPTMGGDPPYPPARPVASPPAHPDPPYPPARPVASAPGYPDPQYPPAEPGDRDTLLPPVPPGDYVRTMMELGELDDPAGLSPLRAPRALSLDEPDDDLFARRTAGRRDAATAPVRPPSHPFLRAAAPAAAKPAVRLPVPRAPSVPPAQAADEGDIFGGLDPLEGLDMLEKLDPPLDPGDAPLRPSEPSEPRQVRAGAASRPGAAVGAAGLRLGRPARRATPTSWLGRGAPAANAALDAPEIFASPLDAVEVGDLDLEEDAPVSEPAPISLIDRAREMRELFEANNYSSALVLADSVLAGDPSHAEARRCADACRAVLADKYLARLGGPRVIPRVAMSPDQLRALALDHRAGFLLSFIDGAMSVEEVLDVSSMLALDALRIMYELREQGAIEIAELGRRPRRR